ncbi:MAG: MFS transporter [Bacteroidetes bacterium]|nr:MFS transporter [Bacteroidota bacterium]
MTDPPEQQPAASRRQIFSWTLFDFGNTAFSVVVVTVIFPRYFIGHIAGGHVWLWGLAVSISMLLAALLAPPLGAVADYSRNRKRFLFLFTLASVVCTGLLSTVGEGMILAAILLFVIANIGFEGGIVFYDSFLPGLTTKKNYGRVSGYGFAMGYLGSLAILMIVSLLLPGSDDPGYLDTVRYTFLIAAGFFFVFSLPLFFGVPEPPTAQERPASLIRAGIRRASKTFKSLFVERQHPSLARFLVAFFIYNDGILTVIAFAAVFAEKVLAMTDTEIIGFFAVVQTSAVIGSIVFGIITDKIGPKKTITITLLLWIAVVIAAFFVQNAGQFFLVAMAAGVATGSSQSSSRSLMALLTPRNREAEFFGFYDGLCGKASAVIGPLVYGIIADLTGERVAALAIGLFFVAGVILLQRVDVPAVERPLTGAQPAEPMAGTNLNR